GALRGQSPRGGAPGAAPGLRLRPARREGARGPGRVTAHTDGCAPALPGDGRSAPPAHPAGGRQSTMSEQAAVRRSLRALFSPRGCPDPYPHYAVLREHAPVARLPDGTVVVSRHADCDRMLRDPVFRVEDDEWIGRT